MSPDILRHPYKKEFRQLPTYRSLLGLPGLHREGGDCDTQRVILV